MNDYKPAVKYSVSLENATQHLFKVKMTIESPAKDQEIFLPAWTPGSYLVRDFAQHIVKINAFCDEKEIAIKKSDKNTFLIVGDHKKIIVDYLVYAFDSSIRAAFLDDVQGFFNGTALFLCAKDFLHKPCQVLIESSLPTACLQKAVVATSMPAKKIDERGFGLYEASSYELLVDFPFQISEQKILNFEVEGRPHKIAFSGDVPIFDENRFLGDVSRLLKEHVKIFQKCPFDSYLFITKCFDNSFGGLEHSDSSVLLISPNCLPKEGLKEPDDNYRTFLSLISHEYFHAWNVKKLKPTEFVNIDFTKENYTTLLWAMEGITSYYDDLLVRRAGLISEKSYWDLMAKNLTKYFKTQGRLWQTLDEASFDAWLKFYRPHENSLNTNISYYQKGFVLSMYLDLFIKKHSEGKSLDDGLYALYENFGDNKGITEQDWIDTVSKACNVNITDAIKPYLSTLKEIPILEALNAANIKMSWGKDDTIDSILHDYFGLKLTYINSVCITSQVAYGSTAAQAGISPKDEIIAINDVRVDEKNISDIFFKNTLCETYDFIVARNNRIRKYKVKRSKENIGKLVVSL